MSMEYASDFNESRLAHRMRHDAHTEAMKVKCIGQRIANGKITKIIIPKINIVLMSMEYAMNTNHRNGRTTGTKNVLRTLTPGFRLKFWPIHIRCNFANTQWILPKLKLERFLFGLSRKVLSNMVLECYRSPKSENVDYFKN